jgi:hypothetical protein
MKTHLTMQELEDLGFEVQRNYRYIGFVTQVRENGAMRIETTYEMPSGDFVSQEVKIDLPYEKMKPEQIIELNKILNR